MLLINFFSVRDVSIKFARNITNSILNLCKIYTTQKCCKLLNLKNINATNFVNYNILKLTCCKSFTCKANLNLN